MALTEVKYLVTLPLPTPSLFMWICCHETAWLDLINFFQHHVILMQHEVMLRKYQMIWDYTDKCFDWAVQHATKAEILSPTFQLMQTSHLRRWQVPHRSCAFLPSWPQTLLGVSVQTDWRLQAGVSTHQVQSQAVMRRGAVEKLCKDLWLDCPPRGSPVQDRPVSQAYPLMASSRAASHQGVSRDR